MTKNSVLRDDDKHLKNNYAILFKVASSTYIWMGRYKHSLSLDAAIMVSKNCSIIGEHVVIIFLTL